MGRRMEWGRGEWGEESGRRRGGGRRVGGEEEGGGGGEENEGEGRGRRVVGREWREDSSQYSIHATSYSTTTKCAHTTHSHTPSLSSSQL